MQRFTSHTTHGLSSRDLFSRVLWGLFTSVLLIECTRCVCLNVLTLSYSGSGGFRTKSRPSGRETHKRQKEAASGGVLEEGSEKKGRTREGSRKRNECPLNPATSGNVIPISIEAPLWSYERERSQTVLLSSLSLVLWLNYLWKTWIEGMWWVKGFLPTILKAKRPSNGQKNVTSTLDHVKGWEPRYKDPVR